MTIIHVQCCYISECVDVMTAFIPFLVFEVLEGQVYNFLDESIQKRMEGDLD